MTTPILPEQFFTSHTQYPVIDVRSPQEYQRGHLPGAHNVPLFSDDQRALVGTVYKQQGKENAIQLGLELVGPQLQRYVEQVNEITSKYEMKKRIVICCQRGGMRSKSIGMLLATCGYTVYQIIGGHKAAKAYLREQAQKNYQLTILGGKTGCGKTKILQELAKKGEQVLNLEKLARHKGSVFGGLGNQEQPSQEQFMIDCFYALLQCDNTRPIWVEKESYKIGNLSIPPELWHPLQKAPILYIDIPKTERIQILLNEYSQFDPESIKKCIVLLQKKLGGTQTKELCDLVDAKAYSIIVDHLLDYYDKLYVYSMQKSKSQPIKHLKLQNGTIQEYADEIKNHTPHSL